MYLCIYVCVCALVFVCSRTCACTCVRERESVVGVSVFLNVRTLRQIEHLLLLGGVHCLSGKGGWGAVYVTLAVYVETLSTQNAPISNISIRYVTRMDESCHTYE